VNRRHRLQFLKRICRELNIIAIASLRAIEILDRLGTALREFATSRSISSDGVP
jgi:hypothetical protein